LHLKALESHMLRLIAAAKSKKMKKSLPLFLLLVISFSISAQWDLSQGGDKDYSGRREVDESQRRYLQLQREQLYFKGYPCKDDCSGHIAGYNWAMRKGIEDPRKCGGNSQSFYEGCLAYANGL
jgi:hypothetical protein